VSTREFTEEELELAARSALEPRLRAVKPTMHAIAAAVAAEHSLPVSALLGRSRFKHVVWARQALYSALRAQGLSYPAIARFLQLDHTTVLYGVRAHQRRLESA
jgi:chromosomal replication initiation ATPase DnaA